VRRTLAALAACVVLTVGACSGGSDVEPFVGNWSQHAGSLRINNDSTVDMTYQVSDDNGMPSFPELKLKINSVDGNVATAKVTSSTDGKVPTGSVLLLTLKDPGILVAMPDGTVRAWCDKPSQEAGECGA